MWRIARLALTWLLALVVPMQGVAATAMSTCGVERHDSHARLSAAMHHHADGDQGRATVTEKAAHKCDVCASCCLGAAVLPRMSSFASLALAHRFAPRLEKALASHVNERLERPPRSIA